MDDNISRIEVVVYVRHGRVRIGDTEDGVALNIEPYVSTDAVVIDEDDLAAIERAVRFVAETRGA